MLHFEKKQPVENDIDISIHNYKIAMLCFDNMLHADEKIDPMYQVCPSKWSLLHGKPRKIS